MNNGGLCIPMSVLSGTIAGAFAAYYRGAGWLTWGYAVLAFMISIAVAAAFYYCADYLLLNATPKKQKPVTNFFCMLLYFIMPLLSAAVASSTSIFATYGILELFA